MGIPRKKYEPGKNAYRWKRGLDWVAYAFKVGCREKVSRAVMREIQDLSERRWGLICAMIADGDLLKTARGLAIDWSSCLLEIEKIKDGKGVTSATYRALAPLLSTIPRCTKCSLVGHTAAGCDLQSIVWYAERREERV